jgi:hypothetical protein
MRLVVWNCNMALDRKLQRLLELKPDVAVVPECPDLRSPRMDATRRVTTWSCWKGDDRNKGLGVLTFRGLRGEAFRPARSKFQYFLPVRLASPFNVTLVAVWTHIRTKRLRDYRPTLLGGLDAILGELPSRDAILAGDFNFPDVRPVEERYKVKSAYHHHFREEPFYESRMTSFMCRDKTRGYHLDYICVPSPWVRRIKRVEVGEWHSWHDVSDHVPVVVDVG